MVGQLYAPADVRRDSGFTIFLHGDQRGRRAGTADLRDADWCALRHTIRILVAGLGMILGLILFQYRIGWIGHIGAPPAPERWLPRCSWWQSAVSPQSRSCICS
jgi:POT family proton-dependent oligopeptide transporter